jgi:hypothetical protein
VIIVPGQVWRMPGSVWLRVVSVHRPWFRPAYALCDVHVVSAGGRSAEPFAVPPFEIPLCELRGWGVLSLNGCRNEPDVDAPKIAFVEIDDDDEEDWN